MKNWTSQLLACPYHKRKNQMFAREDTISKNVMKDSYASNAAK